MPYNWNKKNMIKAVDALLAHVNERADEFFEMSEMDCTNKVEAHQVFSSTVCSHFLDTALKKGREAEIPDLNIVEAILLQSNLTFEINDMRAN